MINSVEDAKEYIGKVEKTLIYLSELSKEAGLHSHAGLFLGITAAFSSGTEEIDKVADLIESYTNGALERLLLEGE